MGERFRNGEVDPDVRKSVSEEEMNKMTEASWCISVFQILE